MNSKEILTRYVKSRYQKELDPKDFETGKNDSYLKKDDILIELIQSTPYIKEKEFIEYTPHAINVSIGWFYKCAADRLIYIRMLDQKYYDLIDIEFRGFKSWIFNNIDKYKLQYSSKTTGTVNLILPIIDIPKPFINWEKKHE